MTDDADAIALKIRKAKTDPQPLPETEAEAEKRPEADNLLSIYAAFADLSRAEAVRKFAGRNFSEFKGELADLAAERLGKIGGEMRRLLTEPGYIDGILRRGAERANAMAEPNLRKVFDIMGLLRP
jgi:tryptophanyl-tRNA synthetase